MSWIVSCVICGVYIICVQFASLCLRLLVWAEKNVIGCAVIAKKQGQSSGGRPWVATVMCHINTPSARFRWLGSWEEHTLLTGITYQHLPRNKNASDMDAMGNYDDKKQENTIVAIVPHLKSHRFRHHIALLYPVDELGVWFSYGAQASHIWVWIFWSSTLTAPANRCGTWKKNTLLSHQK